MMLTGKGRIKSITLGLCISFSSSTFAFQTIEISPEKVRTLPTDGSGVSGAQIHNNHFFVTRENDTTIYKMNIDFNGRSKSKLEPFRDLTSLFGKYDFSKSLKGKKYDPQGITSCTNAQGFVFYVVNEVNGDILRADQTSVSALPITYDDFPEYRYDVGNDGFIGITADCSNKKLYVAKQKNPNIVFAIDVKQNKVINKFNLSTGSDVEDDISDLFFFEDGKAYVLQKNVNSIAVLNPNLSTNYIEKRYDYSSIAEITTAKNATQDEVGIAEALVVRNGTILLFLDQRKSNKANVDKSKDVIVELKI